MRETYRLSDPTRQVIADNVQAIAEQMDVTPNYLHQVLAGYETDSFAKFRRLYAACVRAGVDVSPWDASLAEAKVNANQCRSVSECLSKLMTDEAKTNALVVDALEDGQITDDETKPILRAVAKERSDLDALETKVLSAREVGAAAVKQRRNGR